jgi:uncharacterized protein DUF5329
VRDGRGSALCASQRRSTQLLDLMPLRLKSFFALIMAASSLAALAAEPSPSVKLEVEQLLARIAASGCQFRRNGAWHSAADARAHLEKKYQYLLSKHLVNTSDDFISLAATKSTTSGKPYFVKCGAQKQVRSATWMAAQLREVRAAKPHAPTKTN